MKDSFLVVINSIKGLLLMFLMFLMFFNIACKVQPNSPHENLDYVEAVSTVINYLYTEGPRIMSYRDNSCILIDSNISIDTNTSYYYIWNFRFKEYIESDRVSKDVFKGRYITGSKDNYVELEEVIPLKDKNFKLNHLNVEDKICWTLLSDKDMIIRHGKKSKPEGTYSFTPLIPLNKSSYYHMAISVKDLVDNREYLLVLKKEKNRFSVVHFYYDDFWGNSGVGDEGDFLIPANLKKN